MPVNPGCLMLVALVVFIVLLALWSRKSRKGVGEFYTKYGLVAAPSPPQNVLAAIGVKDAMCLKGSLAANSGVETPFYWWEWSSSSTFYSGTTVGSTISCFLAISFPPNSVSQEFEQVAVCERDTKGNIFKKIKDLFAVNTSRPTRIEKLPDGSFIIFWQILWRPKIYEDKIAWLKKNL